MANDSSTVVLYGNNYVCLSFQIHWVKVTWVGKVLPHAAKSLPLTSLDIILLVVVEVLKDVMIGIIIESDKKRKTNEVLDCGD